MKKFLTVLALAGFAMACGDDDEDPAVKPTPDSGVDAGARDGGAAGDAGGGRKVKVTNAGAPCTTASECTGEAPSCDTRTVLGQTLTGGYCSATCNFSDECGNGDCPLGDIIRTVGSANAMGQTAGSCYKKCTPGTSGDCRDGYVCSSLSAALGIPANPVLPALTRTVCLPPSAPRDGGVPTLTDGGVDGGTIDSGL